MTHLAEVVRWLVRCVVAVSSAVILAGPAASAATIPPSSDDATTCDVVSFTDGAPEVALDHADASAHSEAGQSLLGDVLGCSVSPSVEGRAASTTSPRSFIATNTVDDFANLGGSNRAIVIGEDMEGRVIPKARELGADYYDPPVAPRNQWMENNRQWINDRMDEGCTVYNCGPAPG